LSVVQTEAKPPSLRRQRVLTKPPHLLGSHIPVSVHPTSRCTSYQTSPTPITVHSRHSSSYRSAIPQGSELQEPSVIPQEPRVAISSSSNSLRLPSSTVEECPIDLSISKRKSLSLDKNKPPPPVVQQYMNDEQNTTGQSSTSPRNHQRSQDQPSEVHNPTPEGCSVTNQSGYLHQDQKISQSRVSRHISKENSRHQEQIQAISETGNKRKNHSHVTSASAANITTGNYRLGMKPSICPVSVPGSSDGRRHFETPHDQNLDGDSVVHGQQIHVSTHHGTVHHSHDQVCSTHQYHTHGPIQCNSYIPLYHERVHHGLQSEQQQRTRIEDLHTASSAVSDRGKFWSGNKQISPTAAFISDQLSQDSHTVEGDHYQPHLRLVCGRCSQTARFMCSACHNQWYCSSNCQVGSYNFII
jgi:hypothetical protein